MIYAFVVYLWATLCFVCADLAISGKATPVDILMSFLWPIYPVVSAIGFVLGWSGKTEQ
jgi:hypothetical protein